MDAGLNGRVRRVGPELPSDFQKQIGVFLLGMKNKNPDGDQQSVDGEAHDSRRSSQTRSESGVECEPIFATVEIDRQCPSQHDAYKGDHPDKKTEHAGLERGTNGDSPVHRTSGCT